QQAFNSPAPGVPAHQVSAAAAVERVATPPADEVVVAGAAVDGQRLDGEGGGEHAGAAAERVGLDAAVADGRVDVVGGVDVDADDRPGLGDADDVVEAGAVD